MKKDEEKIKQRVAEKKKQREEEQARISVLKSKDIDNRVAIKELTGEEVTFRYFGNFIPNNFCNDDFMACIAMIPGYIGISILAPNDKKDPKRSTPKYISRKIATNRLLRALKSENKKDGNIIMYGCGYSYDRIIVLPITKNDTVLCVPEVKSDSLSGFLDFVIGEVLVSEYVAYLYCKNKREENNA